MIYEKVSSNYAIDKEILVWTENVKVKYFHYTRIKNDFFSSFSFGNQIKSNINTIVIVIVE